MVAVVTRQLVPQVWNTSCRAPARIGGSLFATPGYDPAYPLKLFQRVATVSLETMKIVRACPSWR